MNVSKKLMMKNLPILMISAALFVMPVQANTSDIEQAEIALANQDFATAKTLFTQNLTNETYKQQALFGLAKLNLFTEKRDDAEEQISQLLELSPDNPDYLFWAGRIAGAQAQNANIFSQLGYARDAKNYFSKALKADNTHKDAIMGLIRFHQQAPKMAGGDKASIPELIKQLRSVDARSAFVFELPQLLDKQPIETVMTQYQQALNTESQTDINQFKFDVAMQLSYRAHYKLALDGLLSMDLRLAEQPENTSSKSWQAMRLYQIGKMAAESNSSLTIGLEHMTQYSNLADAEKTISAEWVQFRIAQIQYLIDRTPRQLQVIQTMAENTNDDSLEEKIGTFMQVYAI